MTESAPFLEKWETVKLLGSGGFGDVHEVLTDKGIRCAAKTLRLPVQLGEQLESVHRDVEKFIEGERNLCRLRHDNIVKFLYIAQKAETVVVFMELLDGCSLEIFLQKRPLDEGTIRKFSTQICSALVYMHSQKEPVIHRDINCSNTIVLADGEHIKLIDFGLSIKLKQSISHLSSSSASPKGTQNFMAPELVGSNGLNSVQYSRKSDVYAFGCIVYQMASGARPHDNVNTVFELAMRLYHSGAPALPNSCSAELRSFYGCCTTRDHRERKSAEELMGHEFLVAAAQLSNNRCFYPVTDPQGFCIIININQYSVFSDRMNGLDMERHGSQRDVERVKRLFKKLQFIVEVREDLTAEEIDNFLSEVKKSPELANHGSFVCFLMAHGNEDWIIGSDGNRCKISKLTSKFGSDDCPNLAGKPKIFFIQACRGSGKDEFTSSETDTASGATCPSRGDFLFCYATTEGQVASREPGGSIFVQTLCEYIEKHYKDEHLVDIMTMVNRYMMNHPRQKKTTKLRLVSPSVTQLAYKVAFDLSRAQKS